MFKATEAGKKRKREINLLIDMQISLRTELQTIISRSLSLQRLSWDSLGTKNTSSKHA